MLNASGSFLFDMLVSWEYNNKNPRLKLEKHYSSKRSVKYHQIRYEEMLENNGLGRIFSSISVVPYKGLGQCRSSYA